jgi:hypothetical protein
MGTSNDDKCAFMTISARILIRKRFRSKFVEKIKIRLYVHYFFFENCAVNHLQPTGHVMHQQFDIQQLYALPTVYLCVLYLSENKWRIVPLTA